MEKKRYTRVLSIAGSDSGGGAGIQADIKTMSALGCFASTAITAITVQNTTGVEDVVFLPPETVARQIDAVLSDIGADAIKIGMLGHPEIAHATAETLKKYSNIPIVLDPVLIASVGDTLTSDSTCEIILNELTPLAMVITPNLDEAQLLTGYKDERAWEVFRDKGAGALLLKDGHGNEPVVTDRLFTLDGLHEYKNDRINTRNTHGTGCSLSSAIASYLALGLPLHRAVDEAIKFVHKSIVQALDYKLGKGVDPIFHFHKFW